MTNLFQSVLSYLCLLFGSEQNSFLSEWQSFFIIIIKHNKACFPLISLDVFYFSFFFFTFQKLKAFLWSPSEGLKRPRHFSQSLCLLSSCIHSLPCHGCAIYPAEAQVNKQPIQPHAAPNYTAKLMAGSISRRRANRPERARRKHAGVNTASAYWWGMCGYVNWVPVGFFRSPADSVCTHVLEGRVDGAGPGTRQKHPWCEEHSDAHSGETWFLRTCWEALVMRF